MKTILLSLGLLFAAVAMAEAPPQLAAFPRSALQIATPDARLHPFNIWVADNDAHRAQGLMFVKKMDLDAGMLIIYPAPREITLWMKNCYISMDMIFIRADGRVSGVVANAPPMSEKNIGSDAQVLAVLEVNAGVAKAMNITKGALVIHPAFGTEPSKTLGAK